MKVKGKYLLASALIIIVIVAICVWYFIYRQPPKQSEGPTQPETGTIKIAILGPMTSRVGKDMWVTAQMRADIINNGGGIKIGNKTYLIQLIQKDTNEYVSISDAIRAAEEAIMVDGAQFLVGGYRVEAIKAIREKAMDYKVMYFSFGVTVPPDVVQSVSTNYDRYKYWFSFAAATNNSRTAENYYTLIRSVANKIQGVANLTKVKVAILYEKRTDDIVFNYIYGNLTATPSIEIVGVWRPSPTATDLRTELIAIQESKAHLLFALFSGPAGTVLGTQFQELNIPTIVCGSPGSVTEQTAITYQIVMVTLTKYSTYTEEQRLWYQEFYNRTGFEGPVASGDFGLLVKALSLAGNLSYDAIINVLENNAFETMTGVYKCKPDNHCFETLPGYSLVHAEQWVPGGRNIVWKSIDSYNIPFSVKDIVIPQWIINKWKTG